jgi:hypothetical protein
MAQRQYFGILGTIRATTKHEQVNHETDKTVEVGHQLILAALKSCRSLEREIPGQRTG